MVTKHLNWGYIFAGLSAVAGVAYVLHANAQGSQAPVTNVFPPINTGQYAPPSGSQYEPTDVVQNPLTTVAPARQGPLQPYPVYLI